MKKRPCLLAAVCAVCAQVLVLYRPAWICAAVLTALILEVGLLLYVKAGGAWKCMLLPVLFLTFLFIFSARLRERSDIEARAYETCNVCLAEGLAGHVSRMDEKNGKWYLYVADAAYMDGTKAGGLVAVTEELPEDMRPGCRIAVKGEAVLMPAATNPGQFDARSFYAAQGYVIRSDDPELCVLVRADWFSRTLYEIRCRAAQALRRISCERDLGVWNAMLLGDKGLLDEETEALFETGGISHILAISGLHISFIGMLLYGLFRKMRLPVMFSAAVSAVLLMCYTVLTGNSVSAQRACVMMLLRFGAVCLGRTPDVLSSAALAWILISVRYPLQITQAGCQLSFAAILALGILLPVLEKNLDVPKRKGERVSVRAARRVRAGVLASAAVQLFTWPVLAWHYYRISIYALFMNLFVLPLSGVLFGALLFAAASEMICAALGVSLFLPKILLFPAHLIMTFYRFLCALCARLPMHTLITGRPHRWQLVLYVCVLAAAALLLLVRARRREVLTEQSAAARRCLRTGTYKRRVWEHALFFAALLIGLGGACRLLVRVHEKGLTVVFLDVGQGDGIFLQSGDVSLFVDGGSTSVLEVGKRRIRPLLLYYGVSNVNAWFLTHPDKDHVSGFLELLEECGEDGAPEIDCVYFAAAGSAWSSVNEAVLAHNVPERRIEAGMVLSVGALCVECLYPRSSEDFSETNDLCAVLRAEYGSTALLLMGDVGAEVETLLCARYAGEAGKLSCTLLKAAHHGSAYSSSEPFLRMTGARYAVISCGKNTYGHPSPETIARLAAAGMDIHITQEDGALIVTISGDI